MVRVVEIPIPYPRIFRGPIVFPLLVFQGDLLIGDRGPILFVGAGLLVGDVVFPVAAERDGPSGVPRIKGALGRLFEGLARDFLIRGHPAAGDEE